MSEIEVKALNGLAERLAKLPKADRGISWDLRNWQGHEQLTVYGQSANVCKWLLDNSEAILSALSASPSPVDSRDGLIERLVKALEPFHKFTDVPDMDDDDKLDGYWADVVNGGGNPVITFGDMRAARDVLAAYRAKEQP